MVNSRGHSPILVGQYLLALVVLWLSGMWPACTFAAEPVPGIQDTIRTSQWHYLGPFSMGPREGLAGVAEDPSSLSPDSLRSYPSTLAQGGYIGWEEVTADSAGWVSVEFEGVLWDTLMDIYGYAGIVNGAYACCELDVPAAARALVQAERVGAFWLNGRLLPGDPYGHGFMRIPVLLREGTNRITVGLSGYGDHTFRLILLPVEAPVVTLDDYTLPDMVRGEQGRLWAGVPVLNTTAERQTGIRIEVGGDGFIMRTERTIPSLGSFCIKKVPVVIDVARVPEEGGTIDVPIAVACGDYVYRDTAQVRLRHPGESVKRTFISRIDGSCQYYAVLPPSDFDPGKTYGLILTLHGANVRAENQVDAYRPKSWAYVVAPTNRRPFGFDWQDWGRLDALEVLEIAERALPVDPDRVYLTGHSMGGHGVWHVGLSHPDRFAAIAPAAGWTCFELYIPWFLQKAYIYGEPDERGIRESALRQDWPHAFVENACNLPVLILQGGSDDNVPPFHARLFADRLDQLGYRYVYKEDPGRGHWYSIDSLDVTCVDDPDLMGFLEGKIRNPFPHDVVFKTVNPSHSGRAYWLEVLGQEVPYRESVIAAHVRADTVKIKVRNVRDLAVTLSGELIPSGRAVVEIGDKQWFLAFDENEIFRFSQRAGEFRLGQNLLPGLRKDRERHGPIKQAMFSPFVLVYGTLGEAATSDLLLHLARLEAFEWYRRGNGLAEVIADTEVTPEVLAGSNLILFGGPAENSITKRIDRLLPIRLSAAGVTLGKRRIEGSGLAVKFIYPNPLSPEKLVVLNQATDADGLGLLTSMRTVYAGAGLPDFLIFDSEVDQRSWGGIIAAGFFDRAWRVDPELMYYRAE